MTAGRIETVTPDWRGDTLAAATIATDTVLTVLDTADFDEDSSVVEERWLVVADSAPLQYVAVDHDASTVTLAADVGAVYESGSPVFVWDPTVPGGGAATVEYVATVETDRGPVPAVIPHEKIPVAMLDNIIGASVTLAEGADGEWYVEQVLGRDAYMTARGQFSTSAEDNATRVEITTAADPLGTGEQWAMVLFYSEDEDWTPAKAWAAFTGGYGALWLESPRVGAESARIMLGSDADGVKSITLDADSMDMNAGSYYFGSADDSSVDFRAKGTSLFQLYSNVADSMGFLNFNLGNADYHTIGAWTAGATAKRMRLTASALVFNTTGMSRVMTVQAATGNGDPQIGRGPDAAGSGTGADTYLTFTAGSPGRVEVTDYTGANGRAIAASSFPTLSDEGAKTAIEDLTGALATVMLLRPVEYDTRHATGLLRPDCGDSGYPYHGRGFVAQQVREVIPEAVNGSDGEVLAVDQYPIVATLTAAVQELKGEVDALRAEVAALKGQPTTTQRSK